ncbi:unnamed protein product [Rhizophagus irregularis]|nr:unnamed protein product [Rhizophagus irregularis]
MHSGQKYKVPMCGIAQHLSHLEIRNYYHSIRLVKTNPTSCVSSFYDHWVILSKSDPSGSSLPSFQRLLLHTVSERDYSAQETCHLLLGLPLYHSSRPFVILNLNNESHRWLYGTGIENVMPNSDVKRTERSPVQNLEQLTENNSLSWSDLFNHNIANSENEFKDILGLSVDKLEDKYDNDEGQQEADESRDDACPD